jgi:hypothetical protein
MATKLTPYQWAAAEKMWEQDKSAREIADHFGNSIATVQKHAKENGWRPKAQIRADVRAARKIVEDAKAAAAAENETVETQGDAISTAAGSPDLTLAALREELREKSARIEELEAENKRYKPTYDMSAKYADPVGWLTDIFGDQYWLDLAHRQFAAENTQRHREMLPALEMTKPIIAAKIEELKAKEADWPNAPGAAIPSPAAKKVKMVIDRNGLPTIEQIPIEPQVNNMAGSLADGLVRYTDKGFKLMEPFGCPRNDCFAIAALDRGGKWLYDGYCSEVHRSEVEGDNASSVPGVVTSGVSGAYVGT